MFTPIILLGDLDGFIRIVILLIFILGPMLKGIFGGGDKPQPKPQPQRRPPQRPPQRPGQPQVGAGADKLENEIEEFLRRAAGGKAPARQDPRDVVQAEVVKAEAVEPRRPQQQQQRNLGQQQASRAKARAKAEASKRRQKKSRPTSRPKRKPIQPQRLDPVGGHDDELGDAVEREIDRMEAHVHDVFDHKLGSLGKSTNAGADIDQRGTDSEVWEGASVRRERAADERAKQSAAMKKMIRDPDSVHQAIIMAEILKRPDF